MLRMERPNSPFRSTVRLTRHARGTCMTPRDYDPYSVTARPPASSTSSTLIDFDTPLPRT